MSNVDLFDNLSVGDALFFFSLIALPYALPSVFAGLVTGWINRCAWVGLRWGAVAAFASVVLAAALAVRYRNTTDGEIAAIFLPLPLGVLAAICLTLMKRRG